MDEETLDLRVPEANEGGRLDHFLVTEAPRLSRSAWGRLIREGRVIIDGKPVSKPGHALRYGMQVIVALPSRVPTVPTPEEIPLERLYEDDAIVVVDKPPGMAVHPGHGRRTGTLVHALLGLGVPLAPTGGPERPGIVHRLDLGTSGALVVAKTAAAHTALASAFANREVEKVYLAIVTGHPRPPEGTIERSIGRSRNNALKMTTTSTRGARREALTDYRTLESVPGFALVEARPLTGRTHQIRVHFEWLGHPLVGDDRYGGPTWRGVQDPIRRKALRDFDRLALHASRLSFIHPTTGRKMKFHAPTPEPIESLLAILRAP